MSLFVDASQEEAFRLGMDYFTGRQMKILTSSSPSYMEAEFGSLISLSLDNAKGKAKLNVVKTSGGAYANLNLSFSIEYLGALTITIVGLLITYFYYGMLEIPLSITLLVMLSIVMVVWGLVGYSISITGRKITAEFNMFIQSLASKKD